MDGTSGALSRIQVKTKEAQLDSQNIEEIAIKIFEIIFTQNKVDFYYLLYLLITGETRKAVYFFTIIESNASFME
jgi:hypothetical protein